MTIFGDCIFHRGGIISLASLIQLMDVFGFNERSVRTAVFRLVQNGWLMSEKIGRTSYYRVTESSRQRFIMADQKFTVFSIPNGIRSGIWCCSVQWNWKINWF